MGLFCISTICFSQEKSESLLLEHRYTNNNYSKSEKLTLLNELAQNHPDPQKKLHYSLELIKNAKLLDSSKLLFQGYMHKGVSLRLKSDFTQALESYFEAANIASKIKNQRDLGLVNISIADVYSITSNHKNAVKYYKIGMDILKKENDLENYANGLSNLGDEYFNKKEYDLAMECFMESGLIFRKINSLEGNAFVLGNMGMVYAEKGKDDLAEANINEAIRIMENLELYYPISVYLRYMSDIYASKNNRKAAIAYSKRSLDLATKYGLKEQISDANLQLSDLYEQNGSYKKSLSHFKNHSTFKDSIANIEKVQKMADLRTEFEVSKKQTEVDLLTQQQKTQNIQVALLNQQNKNKQNVVIATIIALFLIVMLAFGLYRRNKYISKTKLIIEEEKSRSDNLLLNILPEETAQELKQNGKVEAKRFDSVTVLFTDFKSFTSYSEKLTPEKLVKSVDYYFSKFDTIIEKYKLEKIKTAGDSYMCAGGLPFPTKDHAIKMTLAAFEITQFVEDSKNLNNPEIAHFDIRIGINTGPVVAGVVGTKKFAYDIWGDTVNVASRMESNSIAGKINIAENTYQLIKDAFACEYRGEIDVKNKGALKMYFAKSIHEKTFYAFMNEQKEGV
ncbi:adenylate/guanylate cyclase domain-containing protein [Lacinutrix sp. WUR7]|uniref:adenylate/guanylate cyclase domain-containing protein n=1 Tax=Lacinutrix sp. WUR7 TaxID=2653681 RepID=UPI00193E2AA6|nr:adenylate/guanylate cyclase domain-containing protein [Lacinutrix sp. WUR7]QRM89043.1 adenylate/guanylate cyclase domain-containing protein [Lacinutrix sp. WUR7]